MVPQSYRKRKDGSTKEEVEKQGTKNVESPGVFQPKAEKPSPQDAEELKSSGEGDVKKHDSKENENVSGQNVPKNRGHKVEKDYSKTELIEIKKWAYSREENNRDMMIVFRTTNGWWKMGGPSGLFYSQKIGPRLGKMPQIRVDRDNYYKFREGVVSVRYIEDLEADMKGLGLKLIQSTDAVRIFKLNIKYTDKEVKQLRRDVATYKKEMRETLPQVVALPEMEALLREVAMKTFQKIKKDPVVVREYATQEFAMVAYRALKTLILLCGGRRNMKRGMGEIVLAVDEMLVYLFWIAEVDIWDKRTCSWLMERLVPLKRMVNNKYQEIAKNE